jgi:hypothetical protein
VLPLEVGHDRLGKALHLIQRLRHRVGAEISTTQVLDARLAETLDLLDDFICRADQVDVLVPYAGNPWCG